MDLSLTASVTQRICTENGLEHNFARYLILNHYHTKWKRAVDRGATNDEAYDIIIEMWKELVK